MMKPKKANLMPSPIAKAMGAGISGLAQQVAANGTKKIIIDGWDIGGVGSFSYELRGPFESGTITITLHPKNVVIDEDHIHITTLSEPDNVEKLTRMGGKIGPHTPESEAQASQE